MMYDKGQMSLITGDNCHTSIGGENGASLKRPRAIPPYLNLVR
jgi:hypothetical protein